MEQENLNRKEISENKPQANENQNSEKKDSEKQSLDLKQLQYDVIQTLKTCYDPEIPVDIYELGLVYRIDIDEDGVVEIDMTLTSPACPVAGSLPLEVERKIRDLPGVKDVIVNVVWEPMWNKDMMSDVAKIKLGFF
jgi:FeS assembly SUF system protein